ncbi:LysE family translocator [Marinomonas sp. 2405UD68-3]|uniref:LysE family translocator n=1 Tax=Marinomonas sp. 2405UD68-3 TaxID=3391835 RepID=UPI0039C94889
MLSLYFGFSVFSFIASITPGPTNILALNQGHLLGMKSTLSFIIGASFGTGLILLVTALGLSEIIVQFPIIKSILAFIGTGWLTFMSWKLFHTPSISISNDTMEHHESKTGSLVTRLTGKHGFSLQLVNPKSWMMSITVSSLFPAQALDFVSHYILLAFLFSLIAIPCIAVWAFIGAILHRNAFFMKRFPINQALAILLAISVWWALIYDYL